VRELIDEMRSRFKGKKLLLGIDRLDPIKVMNMNMNMNMNAIMHSLAP
jgi:trehalose-6-phosphate synthase